MGHSCHSDIHPALVGSLTSLPQPVLSDPKIERGGLSVFSKDQFNALSGPMGLHIQLTPIASIVLVPLRLKEKLCGFLGLELQDKDRLISQDEAILISIFSFDIAQLIEDSHLHQQAKALIAAEERSRLASDLHDSVTQVLFSATLLADVLPQIFRRDPALGFQRLDKLRRLARGALAEMRTMLLELRPSAVTNTPLSDLLAQLTEAIGIRSGISFQLFIEQIPSLPENVQTNFYRIAQESLNNVVKHAQSTQVILSLSAMPLPEQLVGTTRHEVRLVIRDNGVGYASGNSDSEHMGIGIMRERAAAIQAHLSLESRPGYGTQVILVWTGETGSRP
jgi:signal transduction histidine kinase